MKIFEVKGNPEEFVKKIQTALAGRELGKIVSFAREGNEVVVKFSKMGTSEVRFAITASGDGFKCEHKSEKIALTHRAFRGDIEGKLMKVLKDNGATVA